MISAFVLPPSFLICLDRPNHRRMDYNSIYRIASRDGRGKQVAPERLAVVEGISCQRLPENQLQIWIILSILISLFAHVRHNLPWCATCSSSISILRMPQISAKVSK